ncbi:MAG: hypothetical protein RMM28_03160 [Thermoleophilia bacterium]|nr:hypothetical protein [Gaiellaceae bacterium]MDW8338119.1 hypothetical protein [Thermoleophilia bacterium]
MPRRREDRASTEAAARREAGPSAPVAPDTEIAAALRALAEEVGELRRELETLRDGPRPLPAATQGAHGWEAQAAPVTSGPLWARGLESPSPRRPTIPRLALEIAFLLAIATLAGVASLEPPVIVGLLAAAWALVALSEWLAWRSSRREAELLAGIARSEPHLGSDLGWLVPPLEHTAELDEVSASTTKLPPRGLE